MNLNDRIAAVAQDVAKRESSHVDAMARARSMAETLHARVDSAIAGFNAIVAQSVSHLAIEVAAPRVDDKHLHAIEFELQRGRHRAVITVKSKGEVTLVGPFRLGKKEGPCRSFPFSATAEIDEALGDFVERFLEEATSA
jgi:hypothetical protein